MADVGVPNSVRRDFSAKRIVQPLDLEKLEKRNLTAQKNSTHSEVIQTISKVPPTQKKLTEPQILLRERSSSRARSRQNCPELVSQFR